MNARTGFTAAAAACLLILASCSTSSFMGLSKSSHVDTELEEMRAEIENMHAMEDELDEILSNEERLQEAVNELVRLSEEYSTELEKIVAEFSAELDGIPEVTLLQLVEAIETYLENSGTPIPETGSDPETAPASGISSDPAPEDGNSQETEDGEGQPSV